VLGEPLSVTLGLAPGAAGATLLAGKSVARSTGRRLPIRMNVGEVHHPTPIVQPGRSHAGHRGVDVPGRSFETEMRKIPGVAVATAPWVLVGFVSSTSSSPS